MTPEPTAFRGDMAARTATALAQAVTVPEVIEAIFDHAVRQLGGHSMGVWLLDEDEGVLRFAAGTGYVAGSPEAVAVIPLDSDLPGAVAVRTGEVVTYASRAERDRRWPALAALSTDQEAVVVTSLSARGRRLGCLGIGFPAEVFTDDYLTTLASVAEQCALALDRALLYEAERSANETLEFLAAATALMVSALDPEEVVRRLVELAVPRFADACSVFLADGDLLVRQAIAVRTGDGATSFDDPERIPVSADRAVSLAYRTSRPQPIIDPIGTAAAVGLPDGLVSALRAIGVQRGLAVPLEAGGETVGVLVVSWAGQRGLSAHEQYALNGLGARAAIALANARRFRRQREVADLLAAAVLPRQLSIPAGVELAARYIPAAGAVAGDWYDAFTRADGVLVVGLGDAAGHGLPAVAAMAELRNAARGVAMTDATPSGILGSLSLLLDTTGADTAIATAFYATLDPADGRGQWSAAGHPSPLLVAPGQPAHFLRGEGGIPLGVARPAGYIDHPLVLAPGTTLVAVSDGVIERRAEDLDVSLERLRRLVGELGGQDPERIADSLRDEYCTDPQDDCCVLVLRYHGR